ncbi:MAG TPA: APC family permease [Actinomycetes bacterium]|nr:APC family permease [Actinomycetes bacterium]
MTMTDAQTESGFDVLDKGLKPGALGLLSSTVVALASVAPAYSLAATIGFVVIAVGLQAPVIMILAFIPMYCVAVGYRELNHAEPDAGTTFTWATRAFGPKTGWMGGWGIVAADVIVMANLAAIAGSYFFLLFNADGIASQLFWPTVVGVGWIILMTYICYIGIEISARIQYALLGIELFVLGLFSVVALVRVYTGHAVATSIHPSLSWFNPFNIGSFGALATGMLLAVFIYWGFDTALSINEETKDARKTPGRAAVMATFVLLGVYVLVTTATQAFAGDGHKGIGLHNAHNANDVFSVLGRAVFGDSAFGSFAVHLLILMVLSSAAASTLTTILPTARTTLSMAVHKAIPDKFARVSARYMTPTWSTVGMGMASIGFYVAFTAISGNLLADTIASIGLLIAFYYGMTGFAAPVFYRHTLTSSVRNFVTRGVIPVLGGLILLAAFLQAAHDYWLAGPHADSYTSWTMPFAPHWQIGGIFLTGVGSLALGVVLMIITWIAMPAFFRGETLPKRTAEQLESYVVPQEVQG